MTIFQDNPLSPCWSVAQDLLHKERILRHPLDRLQEVEGERHALHLAVCLALPQQAVHLRPVLHQLLQQGGGRQLGGAEPDVGRHGGEVLTENVPHSAGLLALHAQSDPQGLEQLGVGEYQVLPIDE